jgi:hypothetical protein
MDKNFFLLYKKNYEKIIDNLDSIIDSFNNIIEINEIPDSILNSKIHKNFFIEKKCEISYLKKACNKYIYANCKHDFIIDLIDITPDYSKTIKYCQICEYCENYENYEN